mgnify:CR=1 FL=1
MKELLLFIAQSLVNNKDEVIVTESERDGVIIYTMSVHESDMGKVIGKQGKIAKAIRTIIKAQGAKLGKKVLVEIVQ